MEAISSSNVDDLPVGNRQVIEGMLGQPLSPRQRVFIMAYTPGEPPDESVRAEARQRLIETFERIDRYAAEHGITPEMADAAIEEAMEQVRPRRS